MNDNPYESPANAAQPRTDVAPPPDHSNAVAKLKGLQISRLAMLAAALTIGFSETMKMLGLFSVGQFPARLSWGVVAASLIGAIVQSLQIRSIKASLVPKDLEVVNRATTSSSSALLRGLCCGGLIGALIGLIGASAFCYYALPFIAQREAVLVFAVSVLGSAVFGAVTAGLAFGLGALVRRR